jgi:hypothetical protein
MTSRHTQLIAVTVAAMAFATGCATTGSTTSPTPSATGTTPSATESPAASPQSSPTSDVANYSITDWSTTPLELGSKLGQMPSATLASVEIGKHPEASPSFTRISFRFRDALPSCRLAYVPEFRGTDDKVVPVAGNAKLSAVLHTAAGPMGKTVKPTGDGKPTVQAVVKYDDFEGYLAYGIGIQVAANSDQTRPVRCGRLQHTDTTDAPYVVFVDVQD